MDIRKLQRAIVDGLEDVKGHNIAVFDTEHLSPLFERVIIASGTSNRQTKALAASVRDAVKASGHDVLRTEGETNGEWIIVDCGAAVVHLMQPTIREYYHLEEIWGEKPVRMKIDNAPKRLVKAESDKPPVRAKTAAAGKKPASKPPAAKKAAGKPTVAKKAVSRATPVKSTAGRKTSAVKTTTVGSKAAASKTVASKAGAKTAAKKTSAKSVSAPIKTMKVGAPAPRKTAARKTTAKAPAAGVTRTVGVKRAPVAAKKASRKT